VLLLLASVVWEACLLMCTCGCAAVEMAFALCFLLACGPI
jgi:hypothetical protein